MMFLADIRPFLPGETVSTADVVIAFSLVGAGLLLSIIRRTHR